MGQEVFLFLIYFIMSLYWTTSVSTSRARSINEMQARDIASRQATLESVAKSTKIIRVARLATMG